MHIFDSEWEIDPTTLATAPRRNRVSLTLCYLVNINISFRWSCSLLEESSKELHLFLFLGIIYLFGVHKEFASNYLVPRTIPAFASDNKLNQDLQLRIIRYRELGIADFPKLHGAYS
jgi:hypothetical protein